MVEEILAMDRITIPIEKLPPRRKARRWPSLSAVLITIGVVLVALAYLGH